MFGLKNKAEVSHRFAGIYLQSCVYVKNNHTVSVAAVLAIFFSPWHCYHQIQGNCTVYLHHNPGLWQAPKQSC